MKIVSGGQTGVDRAALDAAIALGLVYGGWCPRGGWAEDLVNPPGLLERYPGLRETPSSDPAERTHWNVRDSGRTLILVDARGLDASHGTALTRSLAERCGRPYLIVDVDESGAADRIAAWIDEDGHDLVLNIAGPRENEAPGIYGKALALLIRAFRGLRR